VTRLETARRVLQLGQSMKDVAPRRAIVGLGVIVLLVPGPSHAQEHTVERVSWLAGCWQHVTGGTTVEEQWMAPRGQSMVGMGRTVRADRLLGFELLLLTVREGTLVLEAHPSGQASAAFTATSLSDSNVTFENPEHDFPQRIRYVLETPDSLDAHVSAGSRGFVTSFRRVTCPNR
jgi:hypothetical protein